MDGVATDAWTGTQVAKRREWPFAAVLDDWSEHAALVEPMMNDIGLPMGQMVFDAWTHEQDVRGALGEPGARDGGAADIALQWFVTSNQAMPSSAQDRPGALHLVLDADEYQIGAGTPVSTVRTSKFEFLRAVTGRRSREQVRAYDSDGADLDGILFVHDFFSPAERDIVE
jgi:hypothetical protein